MALRTEGRGVGVQGIPSTQSAKKMDGDVSKLSSRTMKIALKLEDASPAMRQAIDAMLYAGPKRRV